MKLKTEGMPCRFIAVDPTKGSSLLGMNKTVLFYAILTVSCIVELYTNLPKAFM